jgi:hypothetical protein
VLGSAPACSRASAQPSAAPSVCERSSRAFSRAGRADEARLTAVTFDTGMDWRRHCLALAYCLSYPRPFWRLNESDQEI